MEGAQVERVGEGVKITFDSGIMFATNSSALNVQTKENLGDLATVLEKYEDTTAAYGEEQPVADTTTKAGREANRRVEVAIYAMTK